MHKFLFSLFLTVLSQPLMASDSDMGNNSYAVTVQMHSGGRFTVAVGSDPVKIKIVCAEDRTIGSVMLGDIDITAQLDDDGCLTLNDPDNADTAVTADNAITITYSEPAKQ